MRHQHPIDRRTFLRHGALGASALWTLTLEPFMARRVYGAASVRSPYGPVSPKLDDTTGLRLLQLPDGFRYRSFGWTGELMSDGVPTPPLHDGMSVVGADAGSGHLILVRNHEAVTSRPFTDNAAITYLPDGAGGTTNLVFDAEEGRWQRAFASLAGTTRNCAGGVTPWGTWITGEETFSARHGWAFEVGATKGNPRPITDMGRFTHEAVMVDPATGFIYETEDDGSSSGFYRFVPHVRGDCHAGGTLSMLSVKNRPNVDLGRAYPIGTTWDVEWVGIADPAAARQRTFAQGFASGGARFRRLEGAWWGSATGYFLSTDGGQVGEGQVFEYDPRAETLRLIYDSPTAQDVDNPDNLTVTPRGGLLLCEDGAGGGSFAEGERLVGLTLDGGTFTFAINNIVLRSALNGRVSSGDYRQQEWTGACYSPDGRWLFANVQVPGVTFAITGPWGEGPL